MVRTALFYRRCSGCFNSLIDAGQPPSDMQR
jgi:hypothetical protein